MTDIGKAAAVGSPVNTLFGDLSFDPLRMTQQQQQQPLQQQQQYSSGMAHTPNPYLQQFQQQQSTQQATASPQAGGRTSYTSADYSAATNNGTTANANATATTTKAAKEVQRSLGNLNEMLMSSMSMEDMVPASQRRYVEVPAPRFSQDQPQTTTATHTQSSTPLIKPKQQQQQPPALPETTVDGRDFFRKAKSILSYDEVGDSVCVCVYEGGGGGMRGWVNR